MNFYTYLEPALTNSPDSELLTTTDEQVYTRREIDEETGRLANYLKSKGAKPGNRVSVQVHKSVANLCLYLACLRAGLVFHPLNPAYQRGELEYFLGNAEPIMVVCDPENLELMSELAAKAGVAHVETLDKTGEGSLILSSRSQPVDCPTEPRAPTDLAALLYSSGTTGVPKGIMLSHKNLQSNAECLVKAWEFTGKDRLFHCLPIFHVHGLFVALGCILPVGGTMRWAASYNTEFAKNYLPECTVMMGVPTYYTRLLDDKEFTREHCRNMRLFTSGSAPLLAETHIAFEKHTGHIILERYGMTETGMNCSNPYHGKRKPGTVGPPLPGVEARILNDEGKPVALGEVGDLQVRGENVFGGYWRMPEKTKEDFREGGWFNTGDQGTLDADGYVSIVGRSKDMVITGGLNVYPKEVEDVLDQIEGVLESAVIGVPHPDFGEAVVAVIVPSAEPAPSAQSIMDHTKATLANFKVPKHVHFVEALPRNTMSKVQKKALRDELASLFKP